MLKFPTGNNKYANNRQCLKVIVRLNIKLLLFTHCDAILNLYVMTLFLLRNIGMFWGVFVRTVGLRLGSKTMLHPINFHCMGNILN